MARSGQISPLTQSSVAIGDDQGRWFLVNASPDLPAQIEAFPELQPSPKSHRNTPIAGVLVTNADLDHTLGLLSLREGGPLKIYATKAVRASAATCPGVDGIMNAFGGVKWQVPPDTFTPLSGPDGGESSVEFRAISLPGKPPKFARDIGPDGAHSVAYQFLEGRTGAKLLVAPDVAGLNDGLIKALQESDTVLFDGTFWSEDELRQVKKGAAAAADMGHVTIKDCSLAVLNKLSARDKVYIHINNTNPILTPGSAERAAVSAAGVRIGCDGMHFEL